jgi:ABC-type sugar transport system ATPase subunit
MGSQQLEEIAKGNQLNNGMQFKLLHKIFYMTIGLSGSGKSTKLHSIFPDEYIVEPDAIRKEMTGSVSDQSKDRLVWEEAIKRIKDLLERYNLAVLDATNTKSSLRGNFLKEIPPNARKIAIVFQPKGTDEEIVNKLHDRVTKDLAAGKDRSSVPREVIQRQLQQFKNGLQNIENQFDEIQYLDA